METLRSLREENKKNRAEVAQTLGVTPNAVTNYEIGIRRLSLEQVLLLARYYECNAEEIIRAQLNSCQLGRLDSQR